MALVTQVWVGTNKKISFDAQSRGHEYYTFLCPLMLSKSTEMLFTLREVRSHFFPSAQWLSFLFFDDTNESN
jgi:hypothetical protein